MLTYGSVAWINCLAMKGLVDELRKVQRLALEIITGCTHSTPAAGMETLLDIPPIEDTLKASALASCVKTSLNQRMILVRLIRLDRWLEE